MTDKEIDGIIKANIKMAGFISLVKRMREAQKQWEADLANDYDEHWGKSWEKDNLEKEVDEYLKKMEV